jgi:hypothetical protein
MNKQCLLIGISVSLILTNACAQAQEITTDRPDQSNTPVLVPVSAVQIETGIMMEKDNSSAQNRINYFYNTSLLKFGVNENFEARVGVGYLGIKQISDRNSVQRGFGPIALGVKVKLADQHLFWPQAALITNVTLKTGGEQFKPPFTGIDATLALSQPIGRKLSLTMNSGVKWTGHTPEAIWLYAVSVCYTITDRLALFLESYGFCSEAHRADHRIDGGVTYKILPRLQFDASGGIGLSKNSPESFISTGLSIRCLNKK